MTRLSCSRFSGGGTRAAAFSYGVLEELHKTPLPPSSQPAEPRTLLDEVDVISSVSGGSFTAAYYGLYHDRIFDDPEYRDRFLYHNVQADLICSLFNPFNLLRLASPGFSRIDLAAEYYDRSIYHHQNFAALSAEHRRPFVVLNATDMTTGSQFQFTQNHFDLLGSDLNGVPVGRAVAASSAFPFLFCPLTLTNYPKTQYQEPMWVKDAIDSDFDQSPPRWRWATVVRSYFDTQRSFIHLLDGGLSDNLGMRSPTRSLRFPDTLDMDDGRAHASSTDFNLQNLMTDNAIHRLVFIIVDAKPGNGDARDQSSATPGLFDVAVTTPTVPMDNYSFDTVQELRDLCVELSKEKSDPEIKHIEPYVIHLRFDAVTDPKARAMLQGLGTNLGLPKDAVDLLRSTGSELLRDSEEFKRLNRDLKIPA